MGTTRQVLDEAAAEAEVIELLGQVIAWELDLQEPVGADTLLIADLGFQSLDVVMLMVAIRGRYQRDDLPFDEILIEGGEYVTDLSVHDLARFIERHGCARVMP